MFTRHTVLALAAVLSITAFADRAEAGPIATLSGWGTRDWMTYHASFMGQVTLQSDGSLTGHWTIITFNDGEETKFCRYTRFTVNGIGGNGWSFDAYGVCISASSNGYYPVSNRIAIIDYGTPGTNVDYIDINYYGLVGVAVPGGYLQSGDLISAP